MKVSLVEVALPLIFLLIKNVFGADSQFQQCIDPRTCEHPTNLANALCLFSRPTNGYDYACVAFSSGILAIVSYYPDCQPGSKFNLKILEVQGFVFSTVITVGGVQKTKYWYARLSHDCPIVKEIQNHPYDQTGHTFNPAMKPTIISDDLGVLMYQEIYGEYEANCAQFFPGEDGDCSCKSYYNLRKPVTTISLNYVKSTKIGYVSNNDLDGMKNYINDFGLNGINCQVSSKPVTGSFPVIRTEMCTTEGYSSQPYCESCDSAKLSNTVASYDPDDLDDLDAYKLSKICEYWARGPNPKNGSCTTNCCNRDRRFMTIAVLPQLVEQMNRSPEDPHPGIVYYMVRGYGEDTVEKSIMQYFWKFC